MIRLTLLSIMFLSACSTQKITTDLDRYKFPDIINRTTDYGFGGFYLNIDKTMQKYKISRLSAHEIQNQMRDELESLSGSFSIFHQAPYLKQALKNAVYNVTVLKNYESGFEPKPLNQGEFYIVLDLDETILTQWYQNGAKEVNQRRAHLGVSYRDKAVRSIDRKTGENLKEVTILNGPPVVTFRPKLKSFIKSLEKLKGYQGLLIFTAKEDLAAWDIIQRWRKKWPQTFRKLKGVFTRNYLTFGTHYNQPSKDLRIIDESLTHVFLIDDNESRVVQKNLNYRIPKFSADFYWDYYLKDHHGRTSDEKWVFESVLDYILVEMNLCQGKQVTECLSKKLGSNDQDLEGYFTWLKQKLPNIHINKERIRILQIFHQAWVCKDYVRTDHIFPQFLNKTFKF